MSTTIFRLKAEMENGSTWEAMADQRDFARWEMAPGGVPFHEMMVKPMATLRHLAYTAGKRAKHHGYTSFESFDDACVLVSRLDMEDEESEDPGQPVASAGT